ncbi:O-antigen ligase family protein [Gynuella sunshinyii]|uniref:Lipid A core-O-antigen ligase-related enzyme n=1 Tax=Gynuella sunshinyii YC6258 TaxID=1445510 RepID=A0A0C5V7B0_9GAMM|nr:O-antigen ligase family protein [Gynuella sunshinyii]AJQ95290.1 lipid A core - O-antigen ligase-related enzyme [Gynuella sunshinyii YC6258]
MTNLQSKLQNTIDKYFPSEYHRGGTYLTAIGIISTLISIFIKLFTPISVNRFPESVMVIAFLIAIYQQRKHIKPGMTFLLIAISIIMPIVFFGINYIRDPITAVKYMDLDKLVKLFMFVPVAWWLGGKLDNWLILVAIFFLGLLIAIITNPALPDAMYILSTGGVPQFGLRNHQHEAAYFGYSFLAFVCFLSRIYSAKSIALLSFWTACILLSLLGVIITQSRGVWLGTIVALTVFWILKLYTNKSTSYKKALLTFIVVIVTSTPLLLSSNLVKERIMKGYSQLSEIILRKEEKISYTSVGTRINTWIDASEWIKKRPLIGWGLWARKDIITQSEKATEWAKKHYGHLHNSYLEIIIAYGFIGLIFLVFSYAWLAKQIISTTTVWVSTLCLLSFTATINIFESYLLMWNGVYTISIILALPYCFYLTISQNKSTSDAIP